MGFDINQSNIEITCEKCGQPVDARVSGYEADVELGPNHDLRVCETDRYGVNLHVSETIEDNEMGLTKLIRTDRRKESQIIFQSPPHGDIDLSETGGNSGDSV